MLDLHSFHRRQAWRGPQSTEAGGESLLDVENDWSLAVALAVWPCSGSPSRELALWVYSPLKMGSDAQSP